MSAKYLVFGAVVIAAPAPSVQPGGLPPPPAITTFAGVWNARTGDGTPYTIALAQSGNTVTGSYQGGDGSQGTIVGSVDGKQLSFAWNQADGLAGFGRFALSADGHTFQGSYSMRETPEKIEGSWNGSRR